MFQAKLIAQGKTEYCRIKELKIVHYGLSIECEEYKKRWVMGEEVMELAKFGPKGGGNVIQRKEQGKVPGCGRAAGNLSWTLTFSKVHGEFLSKGWAAHIGAQDGCSKQWDWECVSLVPVSGLFKPASPACIHKYGALRDHRIPSSDLIDEKTELSLSPLDLYFYFFRVRNPSPNQKICTE